MTERWIVVLDETNLLQFSTYDLISWFVRKNHTQQTNYQHSGRWYRKDVQGLKATWSWRWFAEYSYRKLTGKLSDFTPWQASKIYVISDSNAGNFDLKDIPLDRFVILSDLSVVPNPVELISDRGTKWSTQDSIFEGLGSIGEIQVKDHDTPSWVSMEIQDVRALRAIFLYWLRLKDQKNKAPSRCLTFWLI